MEAIIFAIVLTFAVKKCAEWASGHWQSSKGANRRSSRGQSIPERASSAVQHDVGYWAHQVLHGFPEIRRGLASGWHAGRTAQAQGNAERQRRKTEHLEARAGFAPQIREHRRRQAEAWDRIRGDSEPEFPVLLTGRSKSGRPVNPLTGEPHDTIAVWDQQDLDRRLSAAADDPDMEVTTRPAPSPEEADPWAERIARFREEQEKAEPDQQEPESQRKEGSAMSSDVTYDSVLTKMEQDQAAAENISAEQAKVAEETGQTADEMQALDLDPDTLGAMADHLDALKAAQEAQARVIETSQQVTSELTRQQGQLAEAHKDTAHPADKEFFAA